MNYLSRRGKSKQLIKPSNSRPSRPLGCLDQTTNQRLNAMYQKFISKNRQSNPILKPKVSDSSSNLNLPSDHSPIDEDPFFNKCQISIDKDISIEGVRMKFQDVVEGALEGYDTATQQYLGFIYDKFTREVARLKEVERMLVGLQGKLTVSGLKSQENMVLRELNRELESKIIGLESEIATLKANKELSGLRSTLEKARQNNSLRERNPTPGKDSRFDIQKKLLIKQNLQLKKQLQNTKKQYQLRLQQISSSLHNKNDSSLISENDNKIQGYQQILIHAETLENKVQTLQFQLQRKSAHIYSLQEQIKQLINKPKQEQYEYKLKWEIAKAELESKTTLWGRKINTREGELNEVKTKMVALQEECMQVKKDNIKKTARETNNLKEIDWLKEEIERLKEAVKTKKTFQKQTKRTQPNDIDYDQLKIQYQKIKLQNARLTTTVTTLNSKPNQADALRTQNTVLKQVFKSSQQKSIPKSSIIQAIKKIINIQPPKLKESAQVNSLLTELYEQLEKTRQEMLQNQLQLKQLRLHKNQIDHILHEQNDQQNDFQTTQIDAHFYRSKQATDPAMKQEIKKLAGKLDEELRGNIQAKKQIKGLKGRVKVLEENERKICGHLRGVVDEERDVKRREEELVGLLEWSGLQELTSIYHNKLFGQSQ